MPISYSIDSDQNVIVEVWTGTVTAQDLASHWQVYLADPAVLECRRTLVDIRQAVVQFKGAEMNSLIRLLVVPVLGDRLWRTAIVVDDPVQFGVSRQYQAFAERYSSDQIFRDVTSALAWLKGK